MKTGPGGITDPSVVRLPDGRWLLAAVQADRQRTLLATGEDGQSFAWTDTIFDMNGIPELALLPDGRVRLFLQRSYLSADGGISWAVEPARWLPGADPSFIALPGGGFNLYYKRFTADAPPPAPPG